MNFRTDLLSPDYENPFGALFMTSTTRQKVNNEPGPTMYSSFINIEVAYKATGQAKAYALTSAISMH